MSRLKDPQESALLRAINGSETKQHEQAARLVMADWCEEHGQLRRAKWFRGTAELCVVYSDIWFSRRVGSVVTGFQNWFGEIARNRFWRGGVAASDRFVVPMIGYMAGPVIASMVELRHVVVSLHVQSTGSTNYEFREFCELLRDACREFGVGADSRNHVEYAASSLAPVWAKKIASVKAKLAELVTAMHNSDKPLPAKFKPLPTV